MNAISGAPGSALEDMCRVKPEVADVMAEIFGGYEFEFGNGRVTPREVFANSGFLPLISHMACQRISDMFGLSFTVDTEDNETSIFGVEVMPSFRSVSALVVYLSNLLQVSTDIFGVVPEKIILDDLYEWAMDETKQLNGLPYLGARHQGGAPC